MRRPQDLGLHALTLPSTLQVCSSLEFCQVAGELLPRVWASWEGRASLLLSHVLLPERQGAIELPHPEGGGPQTG